ncbi:MAG: glycosyltransferase family 2 protein [Clostridia bacterium]|nr:glycosyltransferase family 2 protein [Clostridia bacterium]
MSKKLISIVVPNYNEAASLDELYERTTKVMQTLTNYDYEIVFFDDGSTDGSKEKIEELCNKDNHIKAVFYSKNFGYAKGTFYCFQQAKGDCAIILHADLQNPPEEIPNFVERWEKGAQIVFGVKNQSRENKFVYFIRTVFYWVINNIFGVKMIPHATEFELFDKSFIDILKKINTNEPFLRGLIYEYGSSFEYVYYLQDKRKKGKSKFTLSKYYDFAVCGIVNASKVLPRRVIFTSIIAMVLSILELFIFYLPNFLTMAYNDAINGIVLRLIFIFIGLLLLMVSFCAEHLISLPRNNGEKPIIIEEKRINY